MTQSVKKKAAFTLAEVLIALLIIGIVAAMTLPTLFHNIADKKNATKVAVFNSKFIAGLNSAKANGEMGTQFSSTEDFLRNGLSHNLKMIAICGKDELKKCLGYDKIRYEDTSGNEKTVDVSTLQTAKKLNINESGFEDTAAFVMADGTPVLLTYNKKCNDNGGVDKTISNCVAGLFDINGSSQPNMFVNKVKNGKSEARDIRSFNSAYVADLGIGQIGDIVIISAPVGQDSEHYNEMFNSIKAVNPGYERPTIAEYHQDDEWQIANDYCSYVVGGRLPSGDELAQIATALYGTKFSKTSDISGITMQNKDAVYAALSVPSGYGEMFFLWASDSGYVRQFWYDSSYYFDYGNYSSGDFSAICVE